MNSNLIKLFLFLTAITFLQCNPPNRIVNNKDSHLIKDLVIFPIYSKIDIIEQGNKKIVSENISSNAEIGIKKNLENYIPSNVNMKFLSCDSALEEEIIKSNLQFIKTSRKENYLKKVEIPGFLLNILDSLGQNYGLFIFQRGFTRTPDNLKTQYVRRRIAAAASLGFYDTEPNSSYSTMIGLLIDRNRKKISMYKELYWQNRDPNEEIVIRSQIRDIILNYFQNSK